MPDVCVKAGEQEYEIHIAHGLISQSHSYLRRYHGHRAIVVCDETTERLYSEKVLCALRDAGLTATHTVVPSGEQHKNMDMLIHLYDTFLAAGLTRSDVIIALGGGVIGDLAGMAACTFLRGIHFVNIPTTLLSQVDSAVGGKVAVNHPQGQNLIGAFFQPDMVLVDCDTLRDLPERQFAAGVGEMLKYGCILDEALFTRLEQATAREALMLEIDQLIARCCMLKARQIELDPEDRSARRILNFGHTLAHALEYTLGYGTLLHGEAVAIGMVEAARWGTRLGVTPQGMSQRIRAAAERLRLPTHIPPCDKEMLVGAMARDKKTAGTQIELILLQKMGQACAYPVEIRELRDLLG